MPISVERKEKDQGGSYEASIRFTRRLGGLKRIRLQILYGSVDGCQQDRMLGWVSILASWDTCSGYQYYCSGKPHLIQVLFVSSTQDTAASRKTRQRCCKQSLIITPEVSH